jgi:hypothetical protein
MAYSDFTLLQLERDFGLVVRRQSGIFREVAPVEISARLRANLTEDAEIALLGGSEKARSEYLIGPIMSEVYHKAKDRATLFSGTEFNVAPDLGLVGFCDFMLSRLAMAPELRAPVVAVVEAKKEDIPKGVPQCLAELVAAQIFNAAAGSAIETLFGIITTGEVWRFLRPQGTNALIDSDDYFLSQPEKIVGIILSMLNETIPE